MVTGQEFEVTEEDEGVGATREAWGFGVSGFGQPYPLTRRAAALPRRPSKLHTGYRFHMQALVLYKLGFNQVFYTLLISVVLCGKFP